MLTRVEAEKDNPQATLMFGGSTDNYIAAVDKGLLEAYQSPNLDKTPDTYLDPTGTWNPIYVAASLSPATPTGLPKRVWNTPPAGKTC